MAQNIFSNRELQLKANITRHFPMPSSFSITNTIFSLVQTQHYQVKLGDQITIQVGDGKGKFISKIVYLVPTLPLIIAFPVSQEGNNSFIGISFTSNVDLDFAFSAATDYSAEDVNKFRS